MSAEFFLVSLLLAIAPGTGVLFAIACGMTQGARGAVWAALAGAVGVIPHLAAAGVGLSALLVAHPVLYETLRLLGGAYLLWLAVQAWRSRGDLARPDRVDQRGLAILTRGALINLLNPKLTLFFVAFLPQFLDPADPAPARTLVLMGMVLIAQTLVVFLVYGLVAAQVGRSVQGRPWLTRAFSDSIAVLFAGLGLRVILGAR